MATHEFLAQHVIQNVWNMMNIDQEIWWNLLAFDDEHVDALDPEE